MLVSPLAWHTRRRRDRKEKGFPSNLIKVSPACPISGPQSTRRRKMQNNFCRSPFDLFSHFPVLRLLTETLVNENDFSGLLLPLGAFPSCFMMEYWLIQPARLFPFQIKSITRRRRANSYWHTARLPFPRGANLKYLFGTSSCIKHGNSIILTAIICHLMACYWARNR